MNKTTRCIITSEIIFRAIVGLTLATISDEVVESMHTKTITKAKNELSWSILKSNVSFVKNVSYRKCRILELQLALNSIENLNKIYL